MAHQYMLKNISWPPEKPSAPPPPTYLMYGPLLLFLDCHILYSIIYVIVIVNFVIYLFVFGSVKVNRYFCGL